MGNFGEVLANNQAKNINKITDETGKKLETFNNSLTAYNKAKSSTRVATVSINPSKTKTAGAATSSLNPRNTSRANASVEDDGSSSQGCQEEATDMKKGKRKRETNFNTNEKAVKETGKSHPPAENELSLYGGSDLDKQIVRLVETTKSPKVNFESNNDESEPEESDEDDLSKDIANDFSAVEKRDSPIGKNLASIIM